MPEADLSWLTWLVFLPAAAAALLLVVPARWVEAQRWVALFGAAGTLSVSLCVAVGYDDAIHRQLGTTGRPGHAATARLDSRADFAAANAA
jgi:NADH-quinone oxidoreductase subunit M